MAQRLGSAAAHRPGPALKAWQAARDAQLARERQRELDAGRRAELERQAALAAQQLRQAEARAAELLREAGADGEETLRRLHRQALRRKELLAELRQEELAVEAWVGELSAEQLDEALQGGSEASFQQRLDDLERSEAELLERMEACREQRSRVRLEIERIEEGGDHAEKLQRVQERKAELMTLVKRWAVLSLSGTLLARTKRLYEQDKQPSVMRRASDYFEEMTAGRFKRIVAPLGEQRVLAERSTGEWVEPAQLSRGTAEQMYLCIRFALVDEVAASGIRMPLMIDDLFVNFDDERLAHGMSLLAAIAKRHQLLLFTCHHHVRDAFIRQFSGDAVIRI
ncbi:hypothetical protein O9H85_18540 [Paenibacillus filicis]|uniref:DNA double-strand break repair Rad50 ATPase n=1 Tax=Paenibacillus gyeongsangnamensis TaxID=3388067 RepID=A0ABT4QBW7_9BACL|nr:hypothetical protein [Paenibacillus filicis]MCZ8514383.1 hypothetical protein [Paenibacillus filicis]